ncbi:MAG: S41 family peptidase [Chrysiogenales bacterium]
MKTICKVWVLLLLVSSMVYAQANSAPLAKEDRITFVENVSKLLNENYVFPEIAVQIGKHLKDRLASGAFDNLTVANEFAEVMTKELQSISHDKHMRVNVRRGAAAASNVRPNPIVQNYEGTKNLERINYGFTKVEKLDDNIGYLDLTGFPSLASAKEYADLAMKFLSTADALIIDLRRNGGGTPGLIQYVCSYLFEKPTHINSLYYRAANQTTDFITFEKVDGKKMHDIPLFLLTSAQTFSGGEEFAYDIQTQKRGTLIGEVTGGGANPGGMFPVTGALVIFIPTGRAINPVTKTNWEGVGVIPEIKCSADKALETALPLAREAAKVHAQAKDEIVSKQIEAIGLEMEKANRLFAENDTDAEKYLWSVLDMACKNDRLNENIINALGYEKLGAKKIEMAISFFKYNVNAFPASANAYDSLGEAYMTAGNKELAIENYEKSLQLTPDSQSAKEALKKLRGEK